MKRLSKNPPTAAERSSRDDLQSLLNAARQHYSRGEYRQAMEGFQRIVAADPDNRLARQYLAWAARAEQGEEPPARRLPVEARRARGRAQSLKAAGRYADAQREFQLARRLAAEAGIESRQELEQDLTSLEALVRDPSSPEGFEAWIASGNFEAAFEQIEAALGAPSAAVREEYRRRLQEALEAESQLLAIQDGSANSVQDVLTRLAGLRQAIGRLRAVWPHVERLTGMQQRVEAQIGPWLDHALGQARQALAAAAPLAERRARLEAAIWDLEAARRLAPEDDELAEPPAAGGESAFGIEDVFRQTREELRRTESAMEDLEVVARYVGQGRSADVLQARHLLLTHRSYSSDARFRELAGGVQAQILGRANAALAAGHLEEARRWLALAEDRALTGPDNAAAHARLSAWRRRMEQRRRSRRRLQFIMCLLAALVVVAGAPLFQAHTGSLLTPR